MRHAQCIIGFQYFSGLFGVSVYCLGRVVCDWGHGRSGVIGSRVCGGRRGRGCFGVGESGGRCQHQAVMARSKKQLTV